MKRLLDILNLPLTTLIKEEYKNIKDSKHSPVYRKRDVEGFASLFSFFSVNLGKAGSKMKTSLKYIYICLFLGVLIFPRSGFTQSVKPVIDFILPDPDVDFVLGSTVDIYVHVKVKSCATNADTTIWGNIYYWYQTDSMDNATPEVYNWIDSDAAIEEIPSGGLLDTIPFYCDSSELRISATNPVNVIIIWPAFFSPTAPVCDSSQTNIYVTPYYPIGLEEEPIQKFGSTAFPNPANAMQVVFINSKYSKDISSISIMNSLGQMMSIKEFSEGEDSKGYVLPTEILQAGIYHVHILYKDRKREVVKFIKN
jgi:hypothetical protein